MPSGRGEELLTELVEEVRLLRAELAARPQVIPAPALASTSESSPDELPIEGRGARAASSQPELARRETRPSVVDRVTRPDPGKRAELWSFVGAHPDGLNDVKHHFLWSEDDVFEHYGAPDYVRVSDGSVSWGYSNESGQGMQFIFRNGRVMNAYF